VVWRDFCISMKYDNEQFRSWTIIDLDNFRHNVQELRKHLAPGVHYMQIVKADAYGHGSLEIARESEKLGVEWLGVANSDEGVLLRLEGITQNILILSPSFQNEVETILTNDLIPSISDLHFARILEREADRHNLIYPVHIMFDTGMGRAGFLWNEAQEITQEFLRLQHLKIEGISSHFSMSEMENKDFTKLQNDRFNQIVNNLKTLGIEPPYKHIANSAAIINYPQSHHTMVRAGLLSYGIFTAENLKNKINLKPVMTFKSKIGLIKNFPAEFGISYNRSYITKKTIRAAILPIGYGDGYNFLLSNRGKVLIHDHICPILGRITMDMIVVDISEVTNAKVGDEVTLIGHDKSNSISVEELSSLFNGLTYETTCNLGRRAQRVYIKEHENAAIEPISRRTFIANDFSDSKLEKVIEASLNQRLNSNEIGSIVYQEILKKLFYKSDRQMSWKKDFEHKIILSDTDIDPIVSDFFFHTKTKLRYTKQLTQDSFRIVCATNPKDLEEYFLLPDVEYRWLLDSKIDLVNSFNIDRIMINDILLHHKVLKNGKRDMNRVNLEIECSHPKLKDLLGKEVQFNIDTTTYYPKDKHQLTIYIAELTKGITISFDFSKTAIEKVETISLFAGREKYLEEKTGRKKVSMKSSRNEWFFPNSGVVFVW